MKKYCRIFSALLIAFACVFNSCKPETEPVLPPVPKPIEEPEAGSDLDPVPDPSPVQNPEQPSNPHDGSRIWMGLVKATTSTVSVAWTVEEKNAAYLTSCYPSSSYSATEDVKKQYKVAIYEDEACSRLLVAWTVNPGLGESTAKYDSTYPTRFCFSGLKSSTTYYVMVQNLTDKSSRNKPFAVRTADPVFNGNVVTASAKAGDVILVESFDALMYGGDLTTFSAGYSRVDRSALTSPAIPSGEDPDKADPNYYTVDATVEMGLFNTMHGLVDDYGLQDWSMIPGGSNPGTILERPGFLKVGANSQHGYIITPRLSAISEAATVDVTFRAAPYGGETFDMSEKAVCVKVFDDGGVGEDNVLSDAKEGDFVDLTLEGGRGDWKEYTVRLENVSANSRIGFGGIGTAAQSRFNIDDIRITVRDTYEKMPSGYYVKGTVKYSDGKPAAGVSVSDGFSVAVTDSKGHYELNTRKDSWYIYISYPYDAKITTSNGCPDFFKRYSPARHTYDFSLERINPEKEFVLFALADPQAHYNKRSPQTIADTDRFNQETVPDLNRRIAEEKLPCYGVTLGDIVYSEGSRNSNPGLPVMREHFSKIDMPVFQVMGNHDYTYFSSGSPLNTDDASSTVYLRAQRKFEDTLGPVNFSFNRGEVHVVCMRNVIYDSEKDASSYHGGFTDEQFAWFKADLENVPKSKKIILCVHIPLYSITSRENVASVLNLMKQYKASEIFSGHTHCKRGADNVGSTGMYEHVHAAVCGQWWWSNLEGDGCPNGYTVYYMDGTTIRDEYFTGVNNHMNTRDYQMRLYRGNIRTGGSYAYFQWPHDKTLLINVFNGDSRWKSVKVYEDGVFSTTAALMPNNRLEFEKVTKGSVNDITKESSQDWWALGYNIGVVGRGTTGNGYYKNCFHMYKATLKSSTSKIEVRAVDPYGNEYTCSEVIEDGTKYPDYVSVGNH